VLASALVQVAAVLQGPHPPDSAGPGIPESRAPYTSPIRPLPLVGTGTFRVVGPGSTLPSMSEAGVIKILGPPRWLGLAWFPLNFRFELLVDGVVVADLWPGSVAVADVAPGSHGLAVQRPFVRWLKSSTLDVSVNPGEAVELACSGSSFVITGFPEIHRASPKESLRINRINRECPTPPKSRRRSEP
jgi:hypothetical protein